MSKNILDQDFLLEMLTEFRAQMPQIEANLDNCKDLLEDHPLKSIQEILRQVHSLRGETDALGLNFFSNFLKELESLCEHALKLIKEKRLPFGHAFGLTECLEDLKLYFKDVTSNPSEDEANFKSRKVSLRVLADILEFNQDQETDGPEPVSPPTEESQAEGSLEFTLPEDLGSVERLYTIGKIQHSWIAFPVENVTEIVKAGRINPLPVPKSDLVGFFNHKGEVLPLLNPARLASIAGDSGMTSRFHLICIVGEEKFGIATEQVLEVVSIPTAEIKPLEFGNKLYQGIWKAEHENYLILSPEVLFEIKKGSHHLKVSA